MACPPLAALGICRLTYEEESEFATSVVGIRPFLDLPILEDRTMTFADERVELSVLQQKIDGYGGALPGPSTVELQITVPLHGSGIVADDGNPSTDIDDTALGMLLSIIFGGASFGNVGSAVDSAAGPHLVTLDANAANPATELSFKKGGVLGHVNSQGHYQPRSIADVAGLQMHLKTDFYVGGTPTAPSAEDDIYAATSYWSARCPSRTIQMEIQASSSPEDRWLLMGGQIESAPTITREISASGSIPTLGLTITFANFAPLTAAPLASANYLNFVPIMTTPSHLSIKPSGLDGGGDQVSYLDECVHGTITYTLNSPVYQRLASACSPAGIGRWIRSRAVPAVEATISIPFEDKAFFDHWRNRGHNWLIHDQIGDVPGLTWLIDIPSAELIGYGREDQDGAAFQALTFASRIDDGIVSPDASSDLESAAFRLHHL